MACVLQNRSMPKRVPIAVAVVEEESLVRTAIAAFIDHLGPYKVMLATGHGAAFIGVAEECAEPRIAIVSVSEEEGREPDWCVSVQWIKDHWPATLIVNSRYASARHGRSNRAISAIFME